MNDIEKLIKQYVDQYICMWPFSGVIYAQQGNEILFQNAYGMSCHEFSIPNELNTRFSLGSMAKQFTALAIMQLYDKGLIDIDLPVNNYLPGNLKIDNRITTHHLMSHTSGLHNYYTFQDDFFQEYDRTQYSKMEYFNKYINQPPSFEPGKRFEYCNAGYNMLAWLIEEIIEQAFGEYIHNNIIGPLDMFNTYLDDGTNIIKNKAYPYTMEGDVVIRSHYFNEKYSIGAGGLVSNCVDLVKWYECLKTRKLLSDDTYRRFFRENMDGYCYGLYHDHKHGEDRYFHGGDHLGILSFMQNYFGRDICIIILSNNDFTNQYKLGDLISDVIFTYKADLPGKLPETKLEEDLSKKYEGVYLERKIELNRCDDRWEFVRFNGNLHIPIYPVGKHQFSCKWWDRFQPYELEECEDGEFKFFGFKKQKHNLDSQNS